jgi:hypothetical protein
MSRRKLKKKIELNYRKGPAHKSCSDCNYFLRDYDLKLYGGGTRIEHRCKVMGVSALREYKINPDYICDRHDNSERLKRLGVKI